MPRLQAVLSIIEWTSKFQEERKVHNIYILYYIKLCYTYCTIYQTALEGFAS